MSTPSPANALALEQLQLASREQQVILETAGVGIVFIKQRLVTRRTSVVWPGWATRTAPAAAEPCIQHNYSADESHTPVPKILDTS